MLPPLALGPCECHSSPPMACSPSPQAFAHLAPLPCTAFLGPSSWLTPLLSGLSWTAPPPGSLPASSKLSLRPRLPLSQLLLYLPVLEFSPTLSPQTQAVTPGPAQPSLQASGQIKTGKLDLLRRFTSSDIRCPGKSSRAHGPAVSAQERVPPRPPWVCGSWSPGLSSQEMRAPVSQPRRAPQGGPKAPPYHGDSKRPGHVLKTACSTPVHSHPHQPRKPPTLPLSQRGN